MSLLLPKNIDLQTSNSISFATVHVPISSVATTSSTSQYTLSTKLPQPAEEETIMHASGPAMSTGTNPPVSTHITEEQSELIQGLPTTNLRSGDIDSHPNIISPPPIPPLKSGIPSTTTQVLTSVAAATQSAEAEAVTHTPNTATGSPMSARLTEEQSELVQSLVRHNIPLVIVAGVIT
ncbi:hypothetical protein PILCRDRAFT_10580 [Piloderma croceum F 1598]|uniref:Uncharacterized protein n=1 Tax=Piloderma croceum (strain F 1598) TaxID=765440 RepID=A0A0C3FHV3_PILCF|nr:hypothetical protein PILCRDRAFT_10580 [Piloderma croceum F 1598]